MILLSPAKSLAGICQGVSEKFYYAEKVAIKSSYFEKYLLGKKKGIYYIYAIKTTKTNFLKLVQVFKNMDKYPEFMPGYKEINVRKITETKLLTSILFDPPRFPIISRFTNEVEVISDISNYQQCWRQLADGDSLLEEKNKNAPLINNGFWKLKDLGQNGTRISYHLAIKPPISLPLFLYRMLVKNTYEKTFSRILKRADSLP